ncbi:MAG: SPL family radical SAM protein [Faecalibacillus sp.]
MEYLKTKTVLTKVNYGHKWFGIDYNMNLYRGCLHGCIYCDSRSLCYHIDRFDIVKGKENALAILEKELMTKRKKGVIGIGSMSDTYNPLEKLYQQTRQALTLIKRYGFGVSIDTKSDLILRDIDVLKQINMNNDVIIKITITTPHDQLSKVIEPHVCVSSRRFQVIKELSQNGLFVGILLTPVLPFLTDQEEDIREMVKLAYQNGARFIVTNFSMTLRDIQRDYYYQQLDQHFPGLHQQYIKCFKNRYQCYSLKANALYQIFIKECHRYGILYKMEDIIQAYQKERKPRQLSLFEEMKE